MDGNCPFCDYESDTYNGWANHFRQSHDDDRYPLVAKVGREKLESLYSRMGAKEIADKLGVAKRTVYLAFDAAGINTRSQSESAQLRFEREGWEGHTMRPGRPKEKENPSRNASYTTVEVDDHEVRIHRLCAVAWFGFEAVVGNHVHHKNNVPWHNAEDNLEPIAPEEHMRIHGKEHWENGTGWGDFDGFGEINREKQLSDFNK